MQYPINFCHSHTGIMFSSAIARLDIVMQWIAAFFHALMLLERYPIKKHVFGLKCILPAII